jgi:peptidyl-prolyl cis-trans isomerase D
VKKGNLRAITAPELRPTDFNIQGLGSSRSMVRWVYGAKLGEVSEFFSIGDKYVVAVLTEINNKGTMTIAKVRPMIEPILRNKKKAEIITAKIGSAATLQAVASATSQPVSHVDSIQFSSPYIPNVDRNQKLSDILSISSWWVRPYRCLLTEMKGYLL